MQKYLLPILLLNIIICDAQNQWKLFKKSDGVAVYVRKREKSNINELKLCTVLKTNISNLMAVLADKEHYPKWVYGCSYAKKLKDLSDTSCYHYQVTDSPWPFQDRDLICQSTIITDKKLGSVKILVANAPKYLTEQKDKRRVKDFKAEWTLSPLENGSIAVEYFISLDPEGGIPAWLINLFIAEGPVQSIKKLQQRLPLYKSANTNPSVFK